MACCSKKWIHIASGLTRLATDTTGLTRTKAEAMARLAICSNCTQVTRMSWGKYIAWLAKHGIKRITDLKKLESLPPLPVAKPDAHGPRLCRLCKCCLVIKARSADAFCPLDKWPDK